VVSTAVLLSVVAAGVPVLVRRAAARPLLALAAAAILLPAALATEPGLGLLRAIIHAAPASAVVRDGQKWVALAMPAYALGGAAAAVTLRRWLRPQVTALVCSLALLVTLPDLAWGVGGRVHAVCYPAGWWAVSRMINDEPGAVAVLPAGSLRRFAWSGRAPVLDPLPRWLRADVLVTGDLTVSGVTVAGEGNRARAVERMLLAGTDLTALQAAGVTWLVVESGTAGERGAAARTVRALPTAYRDADLTLYRVGGTAGRAAAGAHRAAVIAHLAWLAMLTAGAIGMAFSAWRRSHARLKAG
jgi:hypothetical protein